MKRIWIGLALGGALGLACQGEHQGPGTVNPLPADPAEVARRAERQPVADGSKQILFGDLHVHTTFSPDAFVMSLPLMGGEGAHPPADACDYARHCAALDFWSINDHAEGLSPRHWRETVDSIRACNAVSADPANPDTVAFLGWEWSQVGPTPETHYGHKNVVLRDLGEDEVPRRAIAAPRPDFRVPLMPLAARILLPMRYFSRRQEYLDYFEYQREVQATPACSQGVDTRELPDECHEVARDPAELSAKLDQWGFPSLIIPHGNAWGLMTPPRSSWDLQAGPEQRIDARQTLMEIHSGHGSSEENRGWRAYELDERGQAVCPAPTAEYEPCCWRAGEIVRSRCDDPDSEECRSSVQQARGDYLASGVGAHWSIPGATLEDWKDCGQCRDCFTPAFNFRPGMSAQYALAEAGFRFGFIGSSDVHSGRPGNGFKEHARRQLTEARGAPGRGQDDREPVAASQAVDVNSLPLDRRRDMERGASFLLTGGLAAAHSQGRNRGAIWQALERREVYATSGDRILLWFDLLNAPEGPAAMGAQVAGLVEAPRFRVRALGSFEQRPGCPAHVRSTLSDERIEKLCLGECYHPSDRRRRITRIEVVRILPRSQAAAGVAGRIEDPWRVFACPADEAACELEFEDPEFASGGREAAYYARAIQEPSLAVNGGGLRCETDELGRCVRVRPCYLDERTPFDDDCLSEVEERAWSSPIFVAPAAPALEEPESPATRG